MRGLALAAVIGVAGLAMDAGAAERDLSLGDVALDGLGGYLAAYAEGEIQPGGDGALTGVDLFDETVAPSASQVLGLGAEMDRLTYFTPRLAGFRIGAGLGLGASSAQGVGDGSLPAIGLAEPPDNDTPIELGVDYLGSLDDVTIRLFGGYGTPDLVGSDAQAWSVGGRLGFRGFTLGAAFRGSEGGLEPAREDWNVGLSYAAGPWGVGLHYGRRAQETEVEDEKDGLDALGIGGSYNLAPGVRLSGGFQWWMLDDVDREAVGTRENAWFAFIGTNIRF